jgi:hypothetical protein
VHAFVAALMPCTYSAALLLKAHETINMKLPSY